MKLKDLEALLPLAKQVKRESSPTPKGNRNGHQKIQGTYLKSTEAHRQRSQGNMSTQQRLIDALTHNEPRDPIRMPTKSVVPKK